MRLWSIQHKAAYDEILQNGVLRGEASRIDHEFFEDSYKWMVEQMKKRIGEPPEGVEVPVWAWYQWEGERKRPDMRVHGRCWGEKGTAIVLLTLEVPEKQVLLSDFDYWHVVLNDGDLIFPIKEDKEYSEVEKRESWEKIFDITCSFDGETVHCLSTQATMWEIRREWVIRAEHFASR